MCERIAQYRSKQAYAQALGWPAESFGPRAEDRIPNWNVPPGSQPWLMHRLRNRQFSIEMVNWGYRPSWAVDAGIPLSAHVRLDQATLGPYFKPLLHAGRAVVPADGWYEWTHRAGMRQPWFIQRKSRQPLFLAAISSFRSHNIGADGTGFILVCDGVEGGLVDPGEQRPIVMDTRAASIWMNSEIRPDEAVAAARSCVLNREEFEWFEVTLEVNRYASNGSDLIMPLVAGAQG